jgi:hypothetical protein
VIAITAPGVTAAEPSTPLASTPPIIRNAPRRGARQHASDVPSNSIASSTAIERSTLEC